MHAYITDEDLELIGEEAESLESLFFESPAVSAGEFDDLYYTPSSRKNCSCNEVEHLNQKLEGMSPSEIGTYTENNMGEFLPAIGAILSAALPAIKVALPVVLPMLAQALPGIVKTAGSLVQSATKVAAPAPVTPISVPHVPPPLAARPISAIPLASSGNSDTSSRTLQALMNLLQNPQVIHAISSIPSGSTVIPGANGTDIPTSTLLNVVSQLSGAAAQAIRTPSATPASPSESWVYPEYVFSHEGKLLIDPQDPVEHAEFLYEMITG